MKVIRIVGDAAGRVTELAGAYVESSDVDAADGRGVVRGTRDAARAIRFPSVAEAFAYWHRESIVRPRRPDGQPNRPLTAYTVELLDA